MFIVKLKGGLGNQLFQYALGKKLSVIRNESFKLDISGYVQRIKTDTPRKYSLDAFNIKADIASDLEIKNIKYPFGIISKGWRFFSFKFLRIHNIGYIPSILSAKKKYIDGYWQSYKYLGPIRNILLEEFTLRESIENKYKELLNQINNNSTSIHIRRGDLVSNAKTKAEYHTFGIEYYEEAIKIISKETSNPTFFVFSDDIEWAKQNLKIDLPIVFVSNPQIKDYEELIIMSRCKNNIIANSTFSFWSAWLNQNPNKIVIAPKQWTTKKTSDELDVLPKEWIQI